MTTRKALGRGLSALLPDADPFPPRPEGESALEAPTVALDPNPFQPRSTMAAGPLAELTASIKETGTPSRSPFLAVTQGRTKRSAWLK